MADQQIRAPRRQCAIRARIHLPSGGTVDATVLDISETGVLFEVTAQALGFAADDERVRPARILLRRLPSHFVAQFWSPTRQQWAEGRIVSGVRVSDAGRAARVAAAFLEPFAAEALASLLDQTTRPVALAAGDNEPAV